MTKLGACKHAVEQLRRGGANILGVVLNDVELKRGRYTYYYKSYYSTYDNHYTETRSKSRPWLPRLRQKRRQSET
jgi:Mrp family chromosome partitioning ATPase